MKKILLLLTTILMINAQAEEITRKNTPVLLKDVIEIKENLYNKHQEYLEQSTAEKLKDFKEYSESNRNNSSLNQFVDVKIPLIWYVESF